MAAHVGKQLFPMQSRMERESIKAVSICSRPVPKQLILCTQVLRATMFPFGYGLYPSVVAASAGRSRRRRRSSSETSSRDRRRRRSSGSRGSADTVIMHREDFQSLLQAATGRGVMPSGHQPAAQQATAAAAGATAPRQQTVTLSMRIRV